MRPNLSGVARVMGRIEEIERKIRPEKEEKVREEKKDRFVDVLGQAEKKEKKMPEAVGKENRPVVPGVVPSEKRAAGGWEEHIAPLSAKYGVEEALVRAVIRMESGGQTGAVSPKGAMGLMQLMPGTARMLGVDDPFDPVQNLEGGIKYLSQLSDKYDGDLVKTLAAYNAGPGRVDSHGGVPPFAETQKYVKNVLSMYRRNSGSDD
jgi:soluble lytic murein transglycosylase-like protein